MFSFKKKKAGKKPRRPPLRGYKEKPRMEYEMPWKFLDEASGLVFTKDNSLLAFYTFNGQAPAASQTPRQRLLDCLKLHNAFKKLGTGFSLYLETWRFVSQPVTPFRKAANAKESYDSRYYLILAWTPSEKRRRQIREYFIQESLQQIEPMALAPHLGIFSRLPFKRKKKKQKESDNLPKSREQVEKQYQEIIQYFKQTCNFLTGLLSPFYAGIRQLCADDTLFYLHHLVSDKDRSLTLDQYLSSEQYLCDYLADCTLTYGQIPKIGSQYVQVIRFKSLVPAMQEEVQEALNALHIPYRWTCRFQCLSIRDAKKVKSNYQNFWNSTNTELSQWDFMNPDKYIWVNEEDHPEKQQLQVFEGKETEPDTLGTAAEGFYTAILLVRDADKKACQEKARKAMEAINSLGLTVSLETDDSVEAWRGTQPGNFRCGLHYPAVNALNFITYEEPDETGGDKLA